MTTTRDCARAKRLIEEAWRKGFNAAIDAMRPGFLDSHPNDHHIERSERVKSELRDVLAAAIRRQGSARPVRKDSALKRRGRPDESR